MKKLLLVLGVLVSSVAMAEGNVIEGRLGYSFNGQGKVKDKVVLTGEYRREVMSNLEVGVGLDLKKSEKVVDGSTTITKSGVPVYGVVQYNFDANSDIVPFVKGRLGFVLGGNVSATKTENSQKYKETVKSNPLYAGVGAGVNYKNFVADLSYNFTNSRNVLDYSTKRNSVTLSVGYSLGF